MNHPLTPGYSQLRGTLRYAGIPSGTHTHSSTVVVEAGSVDSDISLARPVSVVWPAKGPNGAPEAWVCRPTHFRG